MYGVVMICGAVVYSVVIICGLWCGHNVVHGVDKMWCVVLS